MEINSRRQFVKQALSFAGLCLLPTSPALMSAPNNKHAVPGVSYTEAKEAYYKRQYEQAIDLYRKLIAADADNIVYYDGLKKTLRQLNREVQIMTLFSEGMSQNPDKVVFANRMARFYRQIYGDAKKTRKLRKKGFEGDLLNESIALSCAAIKKEPDRKYLYYELIESLWRKKTHPGSIDKNLIPVEPVALSAFFEIDMELSSCVAPYMSEWRMIKSGENTEMLDRCFDPELQLAKIENKNRRSLYFNKEIADRERNLANAKKGWLISHCEQAIERGDDEALLEIASPVLKAYPDEYYLRSRVQNHFWKQAKYDETVRLSEEITRYGHAGSMLKLADVYRRTGEYEKSEKICREIIALPFTLHSSVTDNVWCGVVKSLLLQKETGRSRDSVLEALKQNKVSKDGTVRLFNLYARSLADEKRYEEAAAVLNGLLGLSPCDGMQGDPVMGYVSRFAVAEGSVFAAGSIDPSLSRIVINRWTIDCLCVLGKIYRESDDQISLSMVVEKLRSYDPNHSFVVRNSGVV